MNKYIVPICDIQASGIWNQVILGRTHAECQEKLIRLLLEKYDFLEDCGDYREFVKMADKQDLLIGEIIDIEEL